MAPRGQSRRNVRRARPHRRRTDIRRALLRRHARSGQDAPWTSALLTTLVNELYVADEFEHFLGRPQRIPVRHYPHAIAFALLLRHSWRPDDWRACLRRLRGT